jgi:hypothetical protein
MNRIEAIVSIALFSPLETATMPRLHKLSTKRALRTPNSGLFGTLAANGQLPALSVVEVSTVNSVLWQR